MPDGTSCPCVGAASMTSPTRASTVPAKSASVGLVQLTCAVVPVTTTVIPVTGAGGVASESNVTDWTASWLPA